MGIRPRFFVVPAVFSGGRGVVIYVATQFGRIGNATAAGCVISLVLHIFPAQSTGAEGILICTAFAVHDGAFKIPSQTFTLLVFSM